VTDSSRKIAALERSIERERTARRSAEALLESKSGELYDSNQELIGVQEALERKVDERTVALRDARDSALELMEERTNFLARISHELRTPLNSIVGIVQLLLQEDLSSTQRRKLSTVNESSEVLLSLINELLDFTKLEAGEAVVDLEPTDVAQIVASTVDMLAEEASQKDVALYSQVRAGLPPDLMMDASKFRQVVLNLLGNAVKFTTDGSVTVQLEYTKQEELLLSVRDTGVGIRSDRLDKIFMPFKQSDEGLKVYSGGTGLGLPIVQRWVSLLGGSVSVESELGQGSTFTVRLPVVGAIEGSKAAEKDSEVSEIGIPAEATPADRRLDQFADMARQKPLRILVADDNETNRDVVEMQLDYLGYTADYVANGEEVVRAVLEHNYDVVLLDIFMPVMDGEEACSSIRGMADLQQPVIIAVTASAMPGDRERYLASGMDHFLPKPLSPFALGQVLSNLDAPNQAEIFSGTTISDRDVGDSPYIDMDELRNRLGAMVIPMLGKVGPTFVSELPARLQRLKLARETKAIDELASIFHSLKGSSSSAGALRMAALCEEAEVKSRRGELVSQKTVDLIIKCAQFSSAELTNIVDELSA